VFRQKIALELIRKLSLAHATGFEVLPFSYRFIERYELTRASLILRLQDAEDMAAWDEFTGLYGPVVFNVATSRGFQAADAEDLVQEVFMAVASSISNWLQRDDRGSFRAWLLRIARNAAVDMITQKATRSLGRDGSEAQVHLANLPAPSELSSALDLEYERMVFQWAAERACIGRGAYLASILANKHRRISIEAAATQLNTRPGNIYFARSRVMARIKELVAKYKDQS
jgi:RNA polymerase sigma-70 factor, ECF subfamily